MHFKNKKEKAGKLAFNSAFLRMTCRCVTLLISAALGISVMSGASSSMISEVKQTLTFVFVPNPPGDPIPNGTAFFVAVKSEKHINRSYVYLVTARHVFQKSPTTYLDAVLFRINKRDGNSDLLPIPLVGPNAPPILTHTDKTVDIAVIPLAPSFEQYELKCVPDSMLVTKEMFEKLQIKEGDDVFFGGLFIQFPGAKKNIPIIRFGRVAMISDEKVPWDGQMLDLYLMETQSFGGNSGSPVFYNLSPTRDPGTIVIGAPRVFLAGVMKGSFLNANEVMVVNRSPVPISRENAGIAAVVPSYLLYEILFGAEAINFRKLADGQPVAKPNIGTTSQNGLTQTLDGISDHETTR